jgi:hypothetical protein
LDGPEWTSVVCVARGCRCHIILRQLYPIPSADAYIGLALRA